MNAETISPENLARAAAQGVAIALAARDVSGQVEASGPIVVGRFPRDLFDVTLERDAVSGVFTVKSIQPHRSAE